jgi:hypothetical protein
MQSREEFINEAYAQAYRNEPYELIGAVYDLGRTLPEDHSFHKIAGCFKEGRAPKDEYSDIRCMDHPYLVMDEILKGINGELDKLKNTPEVKALRQAVKEYDEPWLKINADKERAELPQWRAYEKLDRSKLEEAGRIAERMKENGNEAGNKASAEFTDMTAAIEKFAASRYGAYGSILGERLCSNMTEAGTAIERFIESEKAYEKTNPNVAEAVIALRMINPLKAAQFDRIKVRSRISLETLQGDQEKKPAVKREHSENKESTKEMHVKHA